MCWIISHELEESISHELDFVHFARNGICPFRAKCNLYKYLSRVFICNSSDSGTEVLPRCLLIVKQCYINIQDIKSDSLCKSSRFDIDTLVSASRID
ncbi:hypothetical protein Hdeb2414_s0015g00451331 [Helianthus debilis subsp. tardiflorus]